MIKTFPTAFEIFDDGSELLAKITMFDMEAATVEIKTVVTGDSWPELAEGIRRAIVLMREGVV